MAAIVLASGSAARRAMLSSAGLAIEVDRPGVDEAAIKADSRLRGMTVEETAAALALAKANDVSPRWPDRLVLAADQMLSCDGEWFDKPADRDAAARQLARLSGRTHRLISSAVLSRDGAIVWAATTMAELTVRPLSDAYIDHYLQTAGDVVLNSVGAYQIEALGVQLFESIRGDHFTILGLPLLPLLAFLRDARVLPS